MRRPLVRALPVAAALLLLSAGEARAHLVSTGFGPLYDGIVHLALSPDDLLGVVGLALLAGLRGRRSGRLALAALPLSWIAGGLAGALFLPGNAWPWPTTISFLLIGLLVAWNPRLPAAAVAVLAAAYGALHGLSNGAAMGESGMQPLGLLGIAATVFALVALISAFVISLRAPWTRVAVRVAGSWIAAIGLLLLGWLSRGASG